LCSFKAHTEFFFNFDEINLNSINLSQVTSAKSTRAMKGRRLLAVVPVLLLLFCGGLVAQDDLADYPIKEEQCENFGCASSPPLCSATQRKPRRGRRWRPLAEPRPPSTASGPLKRCVARPVAGGPPVTEQLHCVRCAGSA